MITPASPSETPRAGFKSLLIVSLWAAIGLACALAMAFFGFGYILDGG